MKATDTQDLILRIAKVPTQHRQLEKSFRSHIDDADAALMEGLEVKILGKLGVDDPYRDISAG